MDKDGKNPRVLLEGIANLMANEIEELTDQALLEECSDMAESSFAQVEQLKKILEARARRMHQDQGGRDEHTEKPLRIRPSVQEMRERIQRVFTRCTDLRGDLDLRNPAEQSEEDLFRVWDRLCEIGAIDDQDG